MSKTIEEKYIATMVLHALGDTIGFKNSLWEFIPSNGSKYGSTLEKLYEFIALGGINNINLSGWNVSDDTILHMAIARSLILGSFEELEKITINQFIKSRNQMEHDSKNNKNRYIGKAVEKHILLLENGENPKDFPFDPYGGGNGSAMRNNCIGLAFFGEENRDKLIEYSILSSKLTHINPIGWLGGLSTALMTAFILEKVHIHKLVPMMLKLINSDKVKKFLNDKNEDEIKSYEQFIQCWKSYYDMRFENEKPIQTKSQTNLIQRLVFYNEVFSSNKLSSMGASGYSAVIVAYDCLLDCDGSWEKLVIYSMINNFDSDTIGAIAGGFYGTLYGFNNVPENNMKYIEFKDKLIKLGKLLYKKYFLHESLKISL